MPRHVIDTADIVDRPRVRVRVVEVEIGVRAQDRGKGRDRAGVRVGVHGGRVRVEFWDGGLELAMALFEML